VFPRHLGQAMVAGLLTLSNHTYFTRYPTGLFFDNNPLWPPLKLLKRRLLRDTLGLTPDGHLKMLRTNLQTISKRGKLCRTLLGLHSWR
jgi:hypothetical protein